MDQPDGGDAEVAETFQSGVGYTCKDLQTDLPKMPGRGRPDNRIDRVGGLKEDRREEGDLLALFSEKNSASNPGRAS